MSGRALRDASGSVRRLAAALRPSPADDIVAAMIRLLAATEAGEVTDTTAAAALRRHGTHLHKASDAEAMRAALDQVCAARPERADERREMISAAWAGIEGWHL